MPAAQIAGGKSNMSSPQKRASLDQTRPMSDDWKMQMLQRLQDSAKPVPLKVACITTVANKPFFLDEEYHGRITKEEERILLEGKSGRYLIRDSLSTPGDLTLAFNHAGEINHVKLMYNKEKKTFVTDAPTANTKEFKTINDLMTDVLELYQDSKKKSPNLKSRYNKSHDFKAHSYMHPKWCDECGEFMWGLYNQGYKCQDCGCNVHKDCISKAPAQCSIVQFGRKVGKKLSRSHTTADKPEVREYPSPLPASSFAVKCRYFLKCSQFLSAFNLRDTFVDMSNPMTKCFCEECNKLHQDSKNNNKTIHAPDLQNWSRFRLETREDPLKRDVKKWVEACFAIRPYLVLGMLNQIYTPSAGVSEFEVHAAPSLAYTVKDMTESQWGHEFTDPENGEKKCAQVVLEVLVRPDSFKVTLRPELYTECVVKGPQSYLVPETWCIMNARDLYPSSIMIKIFNKSSQVVP